METITDPEQIRAVWEAGDMGEESLGGDSESGTYNRSNRPPAGPRPDADNPWALLPDDHPERPKQCGGCGTKWVDAETARACERRHGDDITTPAPVGAAVALDLDAIEARQKAAASARWEIIGDRDGPRALMALLGEDVPALVAEVRRLTEENERLHEEVHAGNVRGDSLNAALEEAQLAVRQLCARAEAAEAEVGTLRDTLARRTDSHTQLVRENETLRAKVAEGRRIVGMLAETVVSECEDDPEMCHGHDRTDDGRCPLLVDLNRAHAALAVTTGEGQ